MEESLMAVNTEESLTIITYNNTAHHRASSPVSNLFLHLCQQNKVCSDEFIEEDESQDIDTGPYQSTARSTGNPEQVAVIVKVQEAPNPRLAS